MTTADTLFHPDLLAKYSANGPRYTSYPTALQFRDEFAPADYLRAAADPGASNTDLSLYVHIPFCDTVCFYCGCNKIATKNRAHARPYLDLLKREMALQAACFDTRRPVSQLHWGGDARTLRVASRRRRRILDRSRSARSVGRDRRASAQARL